MNTQEITLTWQDGVQAIDELVSAELDKQEYPQQALDNAVLAVNKNLQLRDYFLGLAKCNDLEVMTTVAVNVISQVDSEMDKVPFLSCLSAFYYEIEANDSAEATLQIALQIDPDYSLAKLLYRVMDAGWSGAEFGAMRKELHSKVVEGIAKNSNSLITEGGN